MASGYSAAAAMSDSRTDTWLPTIRTATKK